MKILSVNSGSSSIKFAVHEMEKGIEARLVSGALDNIGAAECAFHAEAAGKSVLKRRPDVRGHDEAVKAILGYLDGLALTKSLSGVGHRVVHGGTRFSGPAVVTPELLDELRGLVPLAPNHLPHEIAAIEAVGGAIPKVGQVACFDTAFHRTMPMEGQTYPLPENLRREGIIRYGFHGLSYEYVMAALSAEGPDGGRVIIAHLGHGASMAAVRDGRCIDTTMGLTPAGGLMMSTRTGDMDPGVILRLIKQKRMSVDEVDELVYKRAGLLGVSGSTGDMRELLEMTKNDPRAKEAVDLFCYHVKKFIGAFAAALGGLDTLVFTGGIGENAPSIRQSACAGLEFMGVSIDPARNAVNGPAISRPGAKVAVSVIKTDEELMVARHTRDALTTRI